MGYTLPVLFHLPSKKQRGQVYKVIQVGHAQLARGQVLLADPHRGNDLLQLQQALMRLPVRANQAVDAEVAVVGLIPEISAVCIIRHPILRSGENAMVAPLPYTAAHQLRIAVDHIPIIL
ncbi:hypothetical protein D3C81_1754300 [compost metagenome]